jgi:hypothetical protein
MLVVPDVFTMVLPSGLTAMPSGSTPIGICAITSRVGTAVTEATADFLVNRRMDKSQHMRWSRRGADLLLQVRCTVYDGTLGSGFGERFQPADDP